MLIEKNKFLSIEKFIYCIVIFFGFRINLLGVLWISILVLKFKIMFKRKILLEMLLKVI